MPSQHIQSILFDRKRWTEPKAEAWLINHKKRLIKVDKTKNKLRFRQRTPNKMRYTYITKKIPRGIELIIGYSRY